MLFVHERYETMHERLERALEHLQHRRGSLTGVEGRLHCGWSGKLRCSLGLKSCRSKQGTGSRH